MAKTYREIQIESDRLFGKGASREKFQWRQAQQRAAGLDVEKRQRGGVAEVWDRNKNVIVPVASGVAALLTGGASAPLAASLTGAALRGADTKSLKGALVGAGEGYLSGLGASAIGGAVRGGMAGTGIGGTLSGAGEGFVSGGQKYLGMGAGSKAQPTQGTQRVYDPSRGGYVDVGGVTPQPSTPSRVMNYIAKKPEVAALGLNAYSQASSAAANRDIQRQQMEQSQGQFDETLALRKREEERDLERQRRIAELLAPLFQRIAGGQQ